MDKISNKILSVTLALVVILSTMSFTINKHYCGDYLVDTAVFSDVKICNMDKTTASYLKECSMTKKDCCSDTSEFIEGQTELKTPVFDLDLNQKVFLSSFVYSYINLFKGLSQSVIPFKNYSAPIIVKDIHVVDCVFLI
ncbi:MAG: hypothetical protein HRT66_06455 [Flavobacteriaceae bacterium]|nr:hypothetical protein [Flavobacteriaceae bacterium]